MKKVNMIDVLKTVMIEGEGENIVASRILEIFESTDGEKFELVEETLRYWLESKLPSWQPIETAPKDGSHVLLYRPAIQFVGYHSQYYNKYPWRINAPGLPPVAPAPTHWMPLPPAPDEEIKG